MEGKIDKQILSRYLKGNYTKEDQEYVDRIFLEEQYQQELEKLMRSDWYESVEYADAQERDLNHILYKLYYKIRNDKSQRHSGRLVRIWNIYSKIAASILFPLAIIYGIYTQLKTNDINDETSFAEIVAPLGSRINFKLPDGSTGWLNSGSSLKYPVYFGRSRDVKLSGEAFFDIEKDRKPFNVQTGDINISVLGTQFNVSAYEDDAKIDVVLESGKIKLSQIGTKEAIEMDPNDRVVFDSKENTIEKTVVSPDKYLSWKEGKLIFRDDPLEEVIKRLNRWYNVEIELEQKARGDLKLRATFIDEDIEEVLRLIKLAYPIDYELLPREKDDSDNFVKRKIKLKVL